MKQAPVGPEERKSILKKIYHALRQSPMFTHYSVEHIRDSAIKSEQLTFDRSFSKQEYMQAMHTKLAKIEKSYIMNSDEILREMGSKAPTHAEPLQVNHSINMYREPLESSYKGDLNEYQMHPKKIDQEFVSLTNNLGRGINFSFVPEGSNSHISRMRTIPANTPSGMGGFMGSNITMNGGMGLGGMNMNINSSKARSSAQANSALGKTDSFGSHGGQMNMSSSGHVLAGHGISGIKGGMGPGYVGPISLNSAFGQSSSSNSNLNINKGGMYGYLNINGCSTNNQGINGGANGRRAHGNGMPNIIKLDPLTDLGSMQNPRAVRNEIKPLDLQDISTPREGLSMNAGMNLHGSSLAFSGVSEINNMNNFSRMGMNEHLAEMPSSIGGISLTGGGLHRTGAAGSTNTATKLNNSRMYAADRSSKGGVSGQLVHEVKPIDIKEEKQKIRSNAERAESPEMTDSVKMSPREKGKAYEKKQENTAGEEIESIVKEVEKMEEVVCTHKNLFPRWEKQRKVFYDLEEMLHQKIRGPEIEIESVEGILQQLKRHIITLTQEIKEGRSLTFRKRLGRISSAFMQRQKIQPEYQFMSTEELLLEYN